MSEFTGINKVAADQVANRQNAEREKQEHMKGLEGYIGQSKQSSLPERWDAIEAKLTQCREMWKALNTLTDHMDSAVYSFERTMKALNPTPDQPKQEIPRGLDYTEEDAKDVDRIETELRNRREGRSGN